MNDVSTMDAMAQAELVRHGDVTAVELAEAAIANIDRLNSQLNAVIHTMYDRARDQARAVELNGPLSGVPFLLKDLLAEVAGEPYRAGSRFLDGNVSTQDAEMTRRFHAAGLVTLGKTNLPEMAYGPATEPQLFGPTHNPWRPDLSTGGSSGGSAAAVAAGLVPIAHANDGGGSIRIPASCCGLVGLKPSRGRNPLGPRYGQVWGGLVAEHVVSRSVRDTAAALDATHGPDVGAPYWFEGPEESFRASVGRLDRRLRISFTQHTYAGEDIHPDCAQAVRGVASLCESLGHHVEEARLPIDGQQLFDQFTLMLAVSASASIRDAERVVGRSATPDDIEPLVWQLAQRGNATSAGVYLSAVQDLQALSRQVAQFHQVYDVMLTPTLGQPSAPIGAFPTAPEGDPIETRRRMWSFAPFTQLQNVTGQPAMSLPLHWTDAGLPVGVQAVGRLGDEVTLFGLGGLLEAAAPWANRWPSISVPSTTSAPRPI